MSCCRAVDAKSVFALAADLAAFCMKRAFPATWDSALSLLEIAFGARPCGALRVGRAVGATVGRTCLTSLPATREWQTVRAPLAVDVGIARIPTLRFARLRNRRARGADCGGQVLALLVLEARIATVGVRDALVLCAAQRTLRVTFHQRGVAARARARGRAKCYPAA
jgi:hypothetical protein